MNQPHALHRFARMDELETRLLGELRSAGFQRVYTPTFAPLADYEGALGDEVRTEFLTFPLGEEQVLRPEFTTKAVRSLIRATDASGQEAPLRVAYVGPTFRVQRQTGPFPHEFLQLGGELIGRGAPGGDLEILRLIDVLARATTTPRSEVGSRTSRDGDQPWQLRLSHAGLLDGLLVALGTPAALAARVRQDLHRLGRHRERLLGDDLLLRDLLPRMLASRARRAGLSEPAPDTASSTDALIAFERSVLAAEWRSAGASERALALVDSACQVQGGLQAVSDWAREFAGAEAAHHALAALDDTLSALGDSGLRSLQLIVDPCVVRDLEYYTGIVFDLSVGPDALSIGGGGRYDRLLESVCHAQPRPAIGFALDLGALATASPTPRTAGPN